MSKILKKKKKSPQKREVQKQKEKNKGIGTDKYVGALGKFYLRKK